MFFTIRFYLCLFISFLPISIVHPSPIYNYTELVHPVIARHGMVSSQEAKATDIGVQILKDGGNAIDAAVAVAYALTVTLPRAGNLTGGGFMTVYLAKENRSFVIDFREKAPLKAYRDMFLDETGNVDKEKAQFSILSSGVPGSVSGLEYARVHYGTKSYKELVKPAYNLARKGFKVSHDLSDSLKKAAPRLKKDTEASRIFYKKDGTFYEAGDQLKQKQLAKTLRHLMAHGAESFYKGKLAEQMTSFMNNNDGLITKTDLINYAPIERKPITVDYQGY